MFISLWYWSLQLVEGVHITKLCNQWMLYKNKCPSYKIILLNKEWLLVFLNNDTILKTCEICKLYLSFNYIKFKYLQQNSFNPALLMVCHWEK